MGDEHHDDDRRCRETATNDGGAGVGRKKCGSDDNSDDGGGYALPPSSTSTPAPAPLPRPPNPHPMVPVPEALEAVLTETARTLWTRRRRWGKCDDDKKNVDGKDEDDDEDNETLSLFPKLPYLLLGRISAGDVTANEPGYPDHRASIMDGYAVRCGDLDSFRREEDEQEKRKQGTEKENRRRPLEFDLVGKVYAGDDDDDDGDVEDDEKRRCGEFMREDGDEVAAAAATKKTERRTAVYVTTGAVIPVGYDAVIPVEDTALSAASVQILPSKVDAVLDSTNPDTWIRAAGCDVPPGSSVLSKGEVIRPVHLALLTQLEKNDVVVRRKPRVGVLSTGNELLNGHIPDANRPLLLSQLSEYRNCVPIDLGIVGDDEGIENIAERLTDALWGRSDGDGKDGLDVLITTGGISTGEKDVVEQVLVDAMGGELRFGRMNMKPGKPTTFVVLDGDNMKKKNNPEDVRQRRKLSFALPGNPVSASVCTTLLVKPCLDMLHRGIDDVVGHMEEAKAKSEGANDEAHAEARTITRAVEFASVHPEVVAVLAADVKLDAGRPEYHRVSLRHIPAPGGGEDVRTHYIYEATSTGVQRSSRVASLRGASGLMMLPRGGPGGCGYAAAKKGQSFPVLLLSHGDDTGIGMGMSSGSGGSGGVRFGDSMHRRLFTGRGANVGANVTSHSPIPSKPPFSRRPPPSPSSSSPNDKSSATNHHRSWKEDPLKLGIICLVDGFLSNDGGEMEGVLDALEGALIEPLGGKESVATVGRAVLRVVEKDANGEEGCDNDDNFAERLAAVVGDASMEGTDTIFVVVVRREDASGGEGGGVAFRAGLELSRALEHLWTKRADTVAMAARRGAATIEPAAAMFEYVAGAVTVRKGGGDSGVNRGGEKGFIGDGATATKTAMLISCSNIGLGGAAAEAKHLLFHAVRGDHRRNHHSR